MNLYKRIILFYLVGFCKAVLIFKQKHHRTAVFLFTPTYGLAQVQMAGSSCDIKREGRRGTTSSTRFCLTAFIKLKSTSAGKSPPPSENSREVGGVLMFSVALWFSVKSLSSFCLKGLSRRTWLVLRSLPGSAYSLSELQTTEQRVLTFQRFSWEQSA